MNSVKIGIIGCGNMGRHHAKDLNRTENAEITAASDVNESLLKEFSQEFSITNTFSDYSELISSGTCDAVVVNLPTFLHRDAVVQAAEKGLHVFCEKPIARTMKDGEEMVQACRENGVFLMIGFVRRFDNRWMKAKEIIDSGVLGSPVVWRDVRASFGPGRKAWFLEKDQGGGPILDGMIHNFDFANLIFGTPVKVQSGLTRLKESTATDTGSVWVEYDSGHIMSNFWSWGMAEKVGSFSGMDMLGPNGALIFPGTFDAEEFSSEFDKEKEGIYLLKKPGGEVEVVKYELNDMFWEEIIHFAECICNNREPSVTGEDGLKAQKAALIALEEEEL
ncbi:Gfo/Idh/MocA family protein [Planctomycetota bacterium]